MKDRAELAGTLHRELGLRDDFITRDTAFAFAGTARDPVEAIARQSTAFESLRMRRRSDFGYSMGRHCSEVGRSFFSVKPCRAMRGRMPNADSAV